MAVRVSAEQLLQRLSDVFSDMANNRQVSHGVNRECVVANIEPEEAISPFLRAVRNCSYHCKRLCLNPEVLASSEGDASKCPAWVYDGTPDEDSVVDEFSTGE